MDRNDRARIDSTVLAVIRQAKRRGASVEYMESLMGLLTIPSSHDVAVEIIEEAPSDE